MKKLITIVALAFNTLIFAQSGCSGLLQKSEVYGTSDSNPKTWCEIAAAVNTPYTNCMCEEEKRQEVEQNERSRKEAERKAVFDRNREKKKQIDKLKKKAREYSQSENYDEGLALLHQAKSIAETYEKEPKIEMRGYRQYSKNEKISWIQDSIDSMQRAKDNSGDSLSLKLSSGTDTNTDSYNSNNSSPYSNTNTTGAPYSNSSQSKRTPKKEESLFEKNQRLIQQNSENFKRQQAMYEELTPLVVSAASTTINFINSISANRKAKKARERQREEAAKKRNEIRATSQRRVHVEVSNISRKLRVWYHELTTLPTFYTYDEVALEALSERERQLEEYNLTSAVERFLFWESQSYNGHKAIESEYETIFYQVTNDAKRYGNNSILAKIKIASDRFKNKNDFPHLLNSEESFIIIKNQIQLTKARCYKSMGNENKANEILSKLNYNLEINSCVTLIQQTFNEGNHFATSNYYNTLVYYLSNKSPNSYSYYNELNDFESGNKGLSCYDVNYLLGIGVLSFLKTDKILEAENAFTFIEKHQVMLEGLQNSYKLLKQKKKSRYFSDPRFAVKIKKSESILLAIKASILQKKGENTEALASIEKAIAIDKENNDRFNDSHNRYKLWFQYIKASLLIEQEKYAEAKSTLALMKRDTRLPTSSKPNYNKGFNKADFDFLKTYLRYKTKDYNGALMGLRILKSRYDVLPKYYALEADIYKAQGNLTKAKEAEENYIKIITSN